MSSNKKDNLLITQSGGPTHVINQSLAGVVEEALRLDAFDRIYGADLGMHGLMERRFIDLSRVPRRKCGRRSPQPGARRPSPGRTWC